MNVFQRHAPPDQFTPAAKVPRIISVFNHKGGVGKTSATASLGWKLASKGEKVLLVDADPQCNLSGFLVDPGLVLVDESYERDPLEPFFEENGEFSSKTLRYALRSVLEPENVDQETTLGIGPADCFQVCERNVLLGSRALPSSAHVEIPENLWLLAGHPHTAKWDSFLTRATENPSEFPNGRLILGLFHTLLMLTGEKYGFDYILVDLSPSCNTLNKLFTMSSHFLIVPCSPDYFSYMAVRMLTSILVEWDNWMQTKLATAVIGQPAPRELSVRYPMHSPIFLGFTIQLYTLSSKGDGNPAQGFQAWINKIAKAVNESLIPQLALRGLALKPSEYGNKAELTRIPNYQTAGTLGNILHVPVFALPDSFISFKKASSNHTKKKRDEAFEKFEDFFANMQSLLRCKDEEVYKKVVAAQWACRLLSRFGAFNVQITTVDDAIQKAEQLSQAIRPFVQAHAGETTAVPMEMNI